MSKVTNETPVRIMSCKAPEYVSANMWKLISVPKIIQGSCDFPLENSVGFVMAQPWGSWWGLGTPQGMQKRSCLRPAHSLRPASDHNGPGAFRVFWPRTTGKTKQGKCGSVKLSLQKSRGHTLSHREQKGYLWDKGWWQGALYKRLPVLKGIPATRCSFFD